MIAECPPLDTNSMYCNLLQCTHFSDTSVVATRLNNATGFVSAYLKPTRPDVLFVWQVAVAQEARGHGLGLTMLIEILARPACKEVTFIETSINANNHASWSLFRSLARRLGAVMVSTRWFDRERHFDGAHADEFLVRIGPLDYEFLDHLRAPAGERLQ
jgi:L-2,4-diaminobutyric acid acetyltransferase